MKKILLPILLLLLCCVLFSCTESGGGTSAPSPDPTPTPTPTQTEPSESLEETPTPTPTLVPVTGIEADLSEVRLYEGRECEVGYRLLPENADNQNVRIFVADETLASYAEGKLTALKAGKTELIFEAEDGGHRAVVAVEVLAYVAVEQIVTDSSEITVDKGDSLQLTFTVLPENATFKDYTVSVEPSEVVSLKKDGTIRALAEGSATITVTCPEDGVSTTVTVTVIPHENHRMGPWEIVFPTSCKEPGMRIRYCEICGSEKYDYEAIEMIDHAYGEVQTLVAPTRSENGLGEQTCTGCEGKKEVVLRMEEGQVAFGALGNKIEYAFYEDGELYIRGKGQLYSWSEEQPNPLKDLQGVKKVFFSDGIDLITDYTFEGMTEITEVRLPEGLLMIGARAFYGCGSIESINMPTTLQFIDGAAFLGCQKIKTLSFSEGFLGFGQGAFEGCTALETVILPESTTTIGSRAFAGCKSLFTVTLPEGAKITDLPSEVFLDCVALEQILLSASLQTVGYDAFMGCTALQKAFYPESESYFKEHVIVGLGNDLLTAVLQWGK